LQSGRTLTADEDPGPISLAQASTRDALEKLFVARFGAPAMDTLQQRFKLANTDPAAASRGDKIVAQVSAAFKAPPAPLTADETQQMRGAELHAVLQQRLLDGTAIDDSRLQQLAVQRGQAITSELIRLGVPAGRLRTQAAQAQRGPKGQVDASMEMTVHRPSSDSSTPAAAPGGASAPSP